MFQLLKAELLGERIQQFDLHIIHLKGLIMRNLLLILSLIVFTNIGYGQLDPLAAPDCHANIGDLVWNDLDKDGIQDPGEPGIQGVLIRLYRYYSDGTSEFVAGPKATDANGHYNFYVNSNNIDYYLTFEYGATWTQCPCDMGGNRAMDSNLRHSTIPTMGITDTFNMPGNLINDYTIDGGLFEPVLPLDIMDFIVNVKGNTNQVNWSIANVYNEAYMALEKAYADHPFTEIARFEGLAEGNYTYTDYSNARAAGVEYYRLAIGNYDGEVVYSQVIKAETGRNAGEILTIYPNPSKGMVAVNLNRSDLKITALTLTDLTGKLISRQPFNNNSITINLKERVSLNGMYILGVELSNGQVMYRRILLSL